MKSKGVVLVVDDEQDFRENTAEYLSAHGYEVLQAPDAMTALDLIESRTVDAAAIDILMPGMDGLALLDRLKLRDPLMQVVVFSAQSSVEIAVEAMRRGASDYAIKPVKLDALELMIHRACEKALLHRQNRAFQEAQRLHTLRFATDIVAHSPAMRRILNEAAQIARTDIPLLIEGETGVGKEVVAEFIHANSERRNLPLTVLDCASLPENLLESELFGHEKGAFTGAAIARPGMLEIADKGTLLLDEIGELPSTAQSRFLRFLERGAFRRLGANVEKTVDVRVIAATNRVLEKEVAAGRFREDLYHRLLVLRLQIPPLRDRREDILPLAEAFLSQQHTSPQRETPHGTPSLSDAARIALLRYSWPGNVRELAHTIERAAFSAGLTGSESICEEHLKLPSDVESRSILVPLMEAERRHIEAVLQHFDGNRKKTAEVLGVTERHLYRLLQQRKKKSDA